MNLEELLKKIKDIGVRHDVSHLLLIGSAARNEHTILSVNGSENWLSDLEFFVIMNRSRDGLDFQNSIDKLCSNLDIGNNFSIDLSFISQRQARNFGCRFLSYEAKMTGVDIIGCMSRLLPNYSVWDIDRFDLNMTIIWRLYKIGKLLAENSFPTSSVNNTYILARNLLDVLSIELYSQGVVACSYSERIEYCISHESTFKHLDLKVYEAATKYKLRPNFKFELTPDYVVKEFLQLYKRLSKIQNSKNIFEPNIFMRLLRRFYSSLLNGNFSYDKFRAAYDGANQGLLKFFGVFESYLESGVFLVGDFYSSLIVLADNFDFIASDLDDSIYKS